MLLVAGPSPEVIKFIQILSWIMVPLLAITLLVTFLLHLRRRKRLAAENARNDGMPVHALSGQIGYTRGDGEYVFFDHSDLIVEYEKRLSYGHARYTALQKDFSDLQSRYAALAGYAHQRFITSKSKTMEKIAEPGLPRPLQAEINKLAGEQSNEKNELQSKLEQLEKSYLRLEQENRLLQEQLSLHGASDEQQHAIVGRWKEENLSLRNQLTDQDYLQDLVEEKKAQILFLQNQVEQRIRDLYQSEHKRLQTVAEFRQFREEQEAANANTESLRQELLLKQEQLDKMQVVLCEKEEQLTEKQQDLAARMDHIRHLEGALQETKQQLESVKAEASAAGQEQAASRQFLQKIHSELSGFFKQYSQAPPVISLRPEYGNADHGEASG